MILQTLLAELRSGYTLRQPVTGAAGDALAVIQLRDLDERGGQIEHRRLAFMARKAPMEKQLLRPGDVLLTAKGRRNFAFQPQLPFAALASSAFYVLRPRGELILPGFLSWSLNQAAAQRYFENHRAGTNTQNLSKKAVAALDIPLPSKHKQAQVLRIDELWHKQRSLEEAIQSRRSSLLYNRLNQYIHE